MQMASIHQLSAKTVHSLSMGQVVTSVFSVVKELLENALDAGATAVDVRLDDFGLEKIEVRDNGSGLTPEDTAVMGQVHYTSKIQHLDDMGSLASFGFRGEALSAVCASCEVTVATRTASEQTGRLVTLDARGAVTAQRPVARAQGTTVTASSLFSRHPVRRQMYSSARKRKDDLRAVEALLTATAVSQPALRLTLHHNGCQLINKAPCDSITSAALQVLKSDAARLLRTLTLSDPPISVEALLPAPDASPKLTGRSTGDQCFIIVNGRVVTYKKVEKLLRDQFSSRHGLSPAKTPVCVLRVTVPPQQLDVNLEPNKTRLLLLCEEKLLSMLETGLSEFYRPPEPVDVPPVPSGQPATAAAPAATESGASETTPTAPSETTSVATAQVPSASTTGLFASAAPGVTVHEDFSAGDAPLPGVTRDQTNLLGAVSTRITDVLDSTSKSATDALRLNGHGSDFVTEVRPSNDSATEVHLSDDPVTSPVTNAPDAPRPTSVTAETSSGVPELTDIEWDASGESLFGDNFLGVPDDSGEGEHVAPAGDGAASEIGDGAPRPVAGGRTADPWATGRLLDSQGELIEPTKLVTSHGKLGGKPKIQPSILKAFGGSAVRQPPTANSVSNPFSDGPGSTNNGATPAANGGGGSGGVNGRGEGCLATAPKTAGPPPAKRPRPTGPGEPEYEPVASQVVRRAGTAFHYYCKDMRRKYLSLDPTMDIGKLSAALADGWKAALPSVKRQFEDMAREDERRYKDDVRKAKLAELIRTPQRTITDFCRVDTELRRMVAPLTPETAPTPPEGAAAVRGTVDKKSRQARRVQKMSLRGLREQIRRVEAGEPLEGCGAESGDPRVIGPLESHYAWVVLRSSQLLLVNPLRLSETTTLSRLLSTYRFPCQPLSPPLPLTSAALGDSAHSTLCALPRDGSRVADVRVEANGFCVEVSGDSARLVAATDCMEFYGAGDLAEVLRKIAAGAQTLEESRPARVVSWLRAEAVRVSQGGGARMSREEVESLVHDAGDLDAECFHGRPLAAPLYDLVT